jgi:hypothetical protein
MDKKTKLYLGLGVVAVGAYLLFKSKKTTPSLTASAPAPAPDTAKFVGMINDFNSPTEKFNAEGSKFASVGYNMRPMSGGSKFASVGYNMRPMSGGMINSNDVVGARAGSQDAGIFASADGFASVGYNMRPMSGGMINSTDVVGARVGSKDSGIFANQPFTGDVANMVGANGEAIFANQSGKFFYPRTARYGQNEGVFAPRMPKTPMPRRTLPVEPNMPTPVTLPSPLNNLVGQDGSRFFKVSDGKFVNR